MLPLLQLSELGLPLRQHDAGQRAGLRVQARAEFLLAWPGWRSCRKRQW